MENVRPTSPCGQLPCVIPLVISPSKRQTATNLRVQFDPNKSRESLKQYLISKLTPTVPTVQRKRKPPVSSIITSDKYVNNKKSEEESKAQKQQEKVRKQKAREEKKKEKQMKMEEKLKKKRKTAEPQFGTEATDSEDDAPDDMPYEIPEFYTQRKKSRLITIFIINLRKKLIKLVFEKCSETPTRLFHNPRSKNFVCSITPALGPFCINCKETIYSK